MTVYTIGYEKKNIEEYIQILKENKIKILVDVRERAWSYKKDFCKTRLGEALEKKGIKYLHLKDLGNPKIFRSQINDKKFSLSLYEDYLKTTRAGLNDLAETINDTTSNICLTCFEKEAHECHRSIILKVFNKGKDISVVNL